MFELESCFPPPTISVTTGNSLNLSVPQFQYLQNGLVTMPIYVGFHCI